MNREQEFSELFREANRYREQYEANIPALIQKARAETTHMKYSVGGKSLHRGYYCPALVKDKIVGNINRGQLKKKRPKAFDYQYYFDDSDLLRLSEDRTCTEVILHEGNREVGLAIDPHSDFYRLSLCDYEEDLLRRYVSFSVIADAFCELYLEKYKYQDGFLAEAEVKNVCILPKNSGFREVAAANLEAAALTQEEFAQILLVDYYVGMDLIVDFKNDGKRLISYTVKELPFGNQKEYMIQWNTGGKE